ncbi:MAG: hypothetical protein IT356_08920 [Gemmatimonadaceae bacterium]|nr:hypothetical protein [Gemmatimonadaceae bacterium]
MTQPLRTWLRSLAVAVALLAFWDPAVTRERADRATVAVTGDGALAQRVRAELGDRFDVVAGNWPAADALVVADGRLPGGYTEWRAPALAVLPAAGVVIERAEASRIVGLDAAVVVRVSARVRGAAGRDVVFTLRERGTALDRLTRRASGDSELMELALAAPPLAAGTLPLRVEAAIAGSGAPDSTHADLVARVEPAPWRVLFHDARPSWMSTFVQRAVARDPRFTVASRVLTSEGVASATASAAGLGAAASRYDVIVVGAPQALAASDVAALEDFARTRGGSVVLLLDAPGAGPVDRLTGRALAGRDGGAPVAVGDSSDVAGVPPLVATEFAWPAALPPGAEAIATAAVAVAGGSAVRRPVVWASPEGAGRVVASGALDAWRFRDTARSRFDEFWRALLATEAARALAPVEVAAEPAVVRPNEPVRISVTVRDAALAAVMHDGPVTATASVRGELRAPAGVALPLLLEPGALPGTLSAIVRAPAHDGSYFISASLPGADAGAPLVVARDAAPATGETSEALAAWTASRGGAVLAERDIGRLGPMLAAAINPPPHAYVAHPMRSPWWLLVFALALSAEWYMRRRSSLP